MKYLKVSRSTTLRDISDVVGFRNVDNMLVLNGLHRTRDVGRQLEKLCREAVEGSSDVPVDRKISLLNKTVDNSDIFETVALLDNSGWKLYSQTNMIPNYLQIPDGVSVSDNVRILGNAQRIGRSTYRSAMTQLYTYPHSIDPSIFNQYNRSQSTLPGRDVAFKSPTSSPMDLFHIPWGEVTLYSSLSDEYIDFPVYPEEISDGVQASYTTMPELLYQYEPWQVYSSSGPRSNTYTFDFHRDMWTGDHRDGKANELIRFCEANCYPQYQGSAVYTSRVSLYISGSPIISGILTGVNVNWDGPLGLDGFYLHCKLELSITEVSTSPLNYSTVKTKPLIG